VERLEAGRLSLRAHDGYWSGRPFVDAVRVEMGRGLAAQLTDLELGRADFVEAQPADARRLAQRGLQVAGSLPLDLFVLVFEARRATPSGAAIRHLLTTALDRRAMCEVLLQGRAEPAEALLPAWISGYASVFVTPGVQRPSQSAVTAVPAEQRAPELYGPGERVGTWDGRAVSPTGALNLASLWIRTAPPDTGPRR